MTAPDRILIDFEPRDWPTERIMYGEMSEPYIEYVRSDLARAAIREADWQNQRRVDAMRRRHMNAPEDPHVAALCERYGYGAVMDAASRLWARKDSLGAFYVGGCIGLRSDDEATALAKGAADDRA